MVYDDIINGISDYLSRNPEKLTKYLELTGPYRSRPNGIKFSKFALQFRITLEFSNDENQRDTYKKLKSLTYNDLDSFNLDEKQLEKIWFQLI